MILFTYDRVGPPLDDYSPATYLYWSGPSAAAASTIPSATSRPVSLEPSPDARSCSSPTWASRRTSGLHTQSMRPSLGCSQNAASFSRARCATYQSPSVHDMAQSCPTQHQRNVFHSALEMGQRTHLRPSLENNRLLPRSFAVCKSAYSLRRLVFKARQ